MSELKDRLKKAADEIYHESLNAFERRCGLPATTLNKMSEGLSSATLTKIATACPELNMRWLLTGKGDYTELGYLPERNPNGISSDDEHRLIDLECEISKLKGNIEAKDEMLKTFFEEIRKQSQPINQTVKL